MSEPSKETEPVQPPPPPLRKAGLANDRVLLAKRPTNDDGIEFISSNPVKKRSLCGTDQAKAPGPESLTETRGTSLPVLEKFAFPQTVTPEGHSSRLSDAISPKQLPQAFPPPADSRASAPEAGANADADGNKNSATLAPQNSITLDQISCLDFNGVPTNSPGFDVGQIFSADGGIMSGIGMGNTIGPMPRPPPFHAVNTHNTIPFTMYSTGNITTMPQAHSIEQHKSSIPVLPMGSKPPCLHCMRIRKQNLPSQVSTLPIPFENAVQPHGFANPQQNNCHPFPSLPTMLPPAIPQQGQITARPAPRPSQERTQPQPHANTQQQRQAHQRQQYPPVPVPVGSSYYHPDPLPLLRDIAQTVQAGFPYAQVAARHGVAPARVAEVLASVVGAPLLLRGGAPGR